MESKFRFFSQEDIARVSNIKELSLLLKSEYEYDDFGMEVPQRISIIRNNPFKAFDTMPAYSDRLKIFVTKIGAVVPQSGSEKSSVNALVTAFSGETGEIIAVFDGIAITNIKCAAVTALVTDLCAPKDVEVLGLIGSGVQAREQLIGVGAVRSLKEIRIFSRNQGNVTKFIAENQKQFAGSKFVACGSAREAVTHVQVISTATTSLEPVLSAADLEDQAVHINCMGNHSPQSRELPLEVLQNSQLIVEDLDTAMSEAGEVHRNAATIAQLVKREVKLSSTTRTVFASTGHAFLDLVTVHYLLKKFGLK